MKTAVYVISKKGAIQARKIKENFENTDVYSLEKFIEKDFFIIKNGLKEEVKSNFNKYNLHIFISSTGIAVRIIANLIKSKDKDPAVLVSDEAGNFVISLLSGHLGRANEYTETISNILSSVPVITTASDVSGKIAVDTISQKLNARLKSLENAKKITSLIVNGENVKLAIPENIKLNNEKVKGIIAVSNLKKIEISQIIPQNIIIGIGCKRGKSKEEILKVINDILDKLNLDIKSVKKLASIELKKDEKGLLEISNELNVNIEFFSKEEIEKIEVSNKSDFVKSITGVFAVSEPCAYLASNKKGRFLEKKFAENGISISIYEEI